MISMAKSRINPKNRYTSRWTLNFVGLVGKMPVEEGGVKTRLEKNVLEFFSQKLNEVITKKQGGTVLNAISIFTSDDFDYW